MLDLATIPAERLALLDTATLSHGGHYWTDTPPSMYCARELLYKVVTGKHRDATPPGCSVLISILPELNDGPWRDDVRRTAVMRPYLRRLLALDSAQDERRIFAVTDHIWRGILPDVCDALKLDKYGSALRDLAPIIDRQSASAVLAGSAIPAARAALNTYAASATLNTLNAFAASNARAIFNARAASAALNALNAHSESWERGVRTILDIICAS